MNHLPDLNSVLEYRNQRVINRFMQLQPELKDRADELFIDLLKYLWLCKKHDRDRELSPKDPELDFVCVMHQEMRPIDEMWHAFLIFTRDYAEFCQKYFGEFIHHQPNVVEDQPIVVNEFEPQLRKFLSYTFDILGEETVCSWFSEHVSA